MSARTGSLFWLTEVTYREFRSLGHKAVMWVLAEHVAEDDTCFPSQARIAKAVQLSERKVRSLLSELEDDGLIRRLHRIDDDGHRTSDLIQLDRDMVLALPEVLPPDKVKRLPARRAGGLPARNEGSYRQDQVGPTGTDGGSYRHESAVPTGTLVPLNHPGEPPSIEPPNEPPSIEPSAVGGETEPPNGRLPRATDDPVKAEAHRLTTVAFEQAVKPVVANVPKPWGAVMGLIERRLRAGEPSEVIEGAIRVGVDVWSTGGLGTAIAQYKQSQRRSGGSAWEEVYSEYRMDEEARGVRR